MTDDLISREALKKLMWDESYPIATFTECGTEVARIGLTINEIEQIIDNAPTVEVNGERPKGEWLDIYKSHIAYECSCCGRQMPIADYYKFCPQCGAKMRDKDEIEETEK